jgi:hypothetical protein
MAYSFTSFRCFLSCYKLSIIVFKTGSLLKMTFQPGILKKIQGNAHFLPRRRRRWPPLPLPDCPGRAERSGFRDSFFSRFESSRAAAKETRVLPSAITVFLKLDSTGAVAVLGVTCGLG